MRRLSSIIATVALTATGLTITSSAASAAGGTANVVRSTTTAPSSVAGANANRILRLEKSNNFLVIGRNTSVAGSNLHVWKMKEDLSFDTTFGAKDLGADFSAPTSSNSNCVSTNGTSCTSVQAFLVNETADTFAVVYSRLLKGSGNGASSDLSVYSVLTGKISTGAVIAQTKYVEIGGMASLNVSDWSSYGATQLARPACEASYGASINSSPISFAWVNFWQSSLRFDGSLTLSFTCNYANTNMMTNGMAVKEYQGAMMSAIKPTNGSFAFDTSFGTNGYIKLSNPLTECSNTMPAMTSDTSITSMSSTKISFLSQVESYARITTIPSWLNNMNVTVGSYEGCYNTGNVSLTSLTINSFTVDGKLKKAASFPVANRFYTIRWVIDPQGRWNSTVTLMPSGGNVMPSSTPTMIRLLADGSPDTSLGANGMKTLTGLPATVTVNGTSVRMNYSLSGLATTAKGSYFVGFASSGGTPNCNSNSGSYSTTTYPYYFSLESGLLTSYGTNGLGAAYTYETNNTGNCGNSDASFGASSYISSEGRPARVGQLAAIGSQTAGLAYVLWDAADGVIGGGDGTISAASAAGRVDTKVYSTKLPTAVQPDSALTVLTAKQAKDLDIRVSTPKICIALTTSVLLVNPGRCVVRIIDEDTKKVLRTMTTTVKKAEVEQGTTLTTDEPIMFKQANIRLSKQAQAQVAELAEAAKTASRVVVIGHSAALGEVSKYSFAISRDRANAVKAALVKAGVKATIEVVALSYSQPETTKKTEAAQAKNRRAEVFIFP